MNRRVAVAVLFAVSLMPRCALAARGSPDPLIEQFIHGYGVVDVTVISSRLVPRGNGDSIPFITFEVDRIVADTVAGPPLGLRSGERFRMPLGVGYGATIERFDGLVDGGPAPGSRYRLTIRRSVKGGFEHADGSGAAPLLNDAWNEVRLPSQAFIDEVRRLADVADEQRIARCRELVTDANAGPAMRVQAIQHLRYHARRLASVFGEDHRDLPTIAAYVAAWNDPRSSDELLAVLDNAFWHVGSGGLWTPEARRRVILARAFAPFPPTPDAQAARAVMEQRRFPIGMIPRLLESDPDNVGPRVIAELEDARWPLLFRCELASQLRGVYQWRRDARPQWNEALRRFYAAALDAADEPEEALSLSGALWAGLDASGPLSRRFELDDDGMRALTRFVERLEGRTSPRPAADGETRRALDYAKQVLAARRSSQK